MQSVWNSQEIDDVEDTQSPVESVPDQVQVFRHTLNSRIADFLLGKGRVWVREGRILTQCWL